MGAIIGGLVNILQWLAATFSNVASWLLASAWAIGEWVLDLVRLPLVLLWNQLVTLVEWTLTAVFWVIGHILQAPLVVVGFLASLLPDVPSSWANLVGGSIIIPAFSVANQVLPISEALTAFQIWLAFYGLMALWRLITFIRGGR